MEAVRNSTATMVSPPPLSQSHRNNRDPPGGKQDIKSILESSMEILPDDSILLKVLQTSNPENATLSLHDVLMAAVEDISTKDKQVGKLSSAKERMIGNLRAKKKEIADLKSSRSKVDVEAKQTNEELLTVRQEHELLTASHSQLKVRQRQNCFSFPPVFLTCCIKPQLKVHQLQRSAKDSKSTVQFLEQTLAREQKLRGLEQAVLEQYRELGRTMGLAKCGKAIRMAESRLTDALDEEK